MKTKSKPTRQQCFNVQCWLGAWRAERCLVQDFRNGEHLFDNEWLLCIQRGGISALSRQFDANPQPMEIRLLSPEIVPGTWRKVHFAIFKWVVEDVLLAMPFSFLEFPATDGEMLLEQRGICDTSWVGALLKVVQEQPRPCVLQCWNARTTSHRNFAKSWVVGHLTEMQTKDAFSVFRHICTDATVPDRLRDQTGFPIFKAEDPRIRYQETFIKLFSPVTNWEELDGKN